MVVAGLLLIQTQRLALLSNWIAETITHCCVLRDQTLTAVTRGIHIEHLLLQSGLNPSSSTQGFVSEAKTALGFFAFPFISSLTNSQVIFRKRDHFLNTQSLPSPNIMVEHSHQSEFA